MRVYINGYVGYGTKVHIMHGTFAACGSGRRTIGRSVSHVRIKYTKAPVTCEKCLTAIHDDTIREWLTFMESEH